MECEHCECGLPESHNYESDCIKAQRWRIVDLRRAGDALKSLAQTYAGETGLPAGSSLWDVIEEWERVSGQFKGAAD